jgi:hypothetical protein
MVTGKGVQPYRSANRAYGGRYTNVYVLCARTGTRRRVGKGAGPVDLRCIQAG